MESSFRSFSRPVLHAAARVVQEMGKSRAAAFSVGLQDIDEGVQLTTYSEDSLDSDINETAHSEGIFLVFYQLFFPLTCVVLCIRPDFVRNIHEDSYSS